VVDPTKRAAARDLLVDPFLVGAQNLQEEFKTTMRKLHDLIKEKKKAAK